MSVIIQFAIWVGGLRCLYDNLCYLVRGSQSRPTVGPMSSLMAGKKGFSRIKSRHGMRGRQDNEGETSVSFSFAGNNGIRTRPPRHEVPLAESHHGAVSHPDRNGIAC